MTSHLADSLVNHGVPNSSVELDWLLSSTGTHTGPWFNKQGPSSQGTPIQQPAGRVSLCPARTIFKSNRQEGKASV